jgi:hypothetical protein
MSCSTIRSSRQRQNRNAMKVVAAILAAQSDPQGIVFRDQMRRALEGQCFNAAVVSRIAAMEGVRLELDAMREDGVNFSLAAERLNLALFPKGRPRQNIVYDGCRWCGAAYHREIAERNGARTPAVPREVAPYGRETYA